MKARLAEIDKHSKICFHGKAIPPIAFPPSCCCGHSRTCQGECNPSTSCCKQPKGQGYTRSQESIRSMVEASHEQLRQSVCIKSRPSKSNYHQKGQSIDGMLNQQFQDKMHKEMHLTQENFRTVQETNQELRRQMKEVCQQKDNLKQKLDHVEKQLNILIAKTTSNEGGEPSKMQELITYIEAQRDIYKNSVERLLNKLDPERTSQLAQDMDSSKLSEEIYYNRNLKYLPKAVLKSNKSAIRQQNSNVTYSRTVTRNSQQTGNKDLGSEARAHKDDYEDKENRNEDGLITLDNYSNNGRENLISSDNMNNLNEVVHKDSNFEEIEDRTKDNIDDILEEIIRGNNKQPYDKNELLKAKAKISELETKIERLSGQLRENQQDIHITEAEPIKESNNLHKICCEENQRLNEDILNLQQKLEEMKLQESLRQQKYDQQILDLRHATDNNLDEFQRDLHSYQSEINNIKSELSLKESHLHAISREKDALQNQLDERTIQHEELKSKFRSDRSNLVRYFYFEKQ